MLNEKITSDMSITDMLFAMSEGDPGALDVLMRLMKEGTLIDRDSALPRGLVYILTLDSFGIYGSKIRDLHEYVASRDLRRTIGLLRAAQLGFLDRESLCAAIDNYGQGLNIDDLMAQVEARLPNFKKE